MSDDDYPIPEPGEICLGPPCRHFPKWIKTREEARGWLDYKMLSGAQFTINYVDSHLKRRGQKA